MSLRTVHICFIVLSVFLALGFGFWGMRDYSLSKNILNRHMAIGSFLASGLLTVYLAWFLAKTRRMES